MIVYLYRWRLRPEMEQEFTSAWSHVTDQLRERCGSYGSRLHRGDDGLWYGYAQWPSQEVRERAKIDSDQIRSARATMKAATLEMLPDIVLTPLSDYLILPRTNTR